jgi:hypothetical protein
MTTTPRRAPKPAPPPSPEAEPSSNPCQFTELPAAFLAWQRQHGATHSAATLSDLLALARSLNDYGLTLRHAVIDCEAATRIEAIISHSTGILRSGPLPLPIQATAADFIQARILTTELVLGIAKEEAGGGKYRGILGTCRGGGDRYWDPSNGAHHPTPRCPSRGTQSRDRRPTASDRSTTP